MFIRIKKNQKTILVDVSGSDCYRYRCFSPHKYTHYGKTMDNKENIHQDDYYSCSHRNYHGCPDKPVVK